MGPEYNCEYRSYFPYADHVMREADQKVDLEFTKKMMLNMKEASNLVEEEGSKGV